MSAWTCRQLSAKMPSFADVRNLEIASEEPELIEAWSFRGHMQQRELITP